MPRDGFYSKPPVPRPKQYISKVGGRKRGQEVTAMRYRATAHEAFREWVEGLGQPLPLIDDGGWAVWDGVLITYTDLIFREKFRPAAMSGRYDD